MSAAAYDLSDVDAELRRIAHLVDTFTSELCVLDFEGIPENTANEINRITALVWIGRDLTNALAKNVDDNFAALSGKKGGAK